MADGVDTGAPYPLPRVTIKFCTQSVSQCPSGTEISSHISPYKCTSQILTHHQVQMDAKSSICTLGTYLTLIHTLTHHDEPQDDPQRLPNLTPTHTVRPRAPLNILNLVRRSSPPAIHGRDLHSRDLPLQRVVTTAARISIRVRRRYPRPHSPLGPQGRRRLPRDEGAEAPREGRHRARPGPRARRQEPREACCCSDSFRRRWC